MVKSANPLENERARPIGNFTGRLLVVRALVDLRLASVYYSVRRRLRDATGSILEVGCGNSPYRFLIKHGVYTGIDHSVAAEFSYQGKDVLYYHGDTFPVQDGSFDLVFHTEVLEHVENPEAFIKSCWVALKPDGRMFFSVPFSYRYHYIPYDYYRYTPSSLKRICEKAGFTSVTIKPQGTDITVACHKVITVFFRLAREKRNIPSRLLGAIACLVSLPLLALVHMAGGCLWFSISGLGMILWDISSKQISERYAQRSHDHEERGESRGPRDL